MPLIKVQTSLETPDKGEVNKLLQTLSAKLAQFPIL